jgi:putative ABC transport system permease protein
MTITILGRNREIGIMKIIGGSNSQISKFYSIECMITGFVGSIIGLILSVALNVLITYMLDWKIEFPLTVFLFAILVGVLSPTFAGILTQRKIKRQTISDIFNKQ